MEGGRHILCIAIWLKSIATFGGIEPEVKLRGMLFSMDVYYRGTQNTFLCRVKFHFHFDVLPPRVKHSNDLPHPACLLLFKGTVRVFRSGVI